MRRALVALSFAAALAACSTEEAGVDPASEAAPAPPVVDPEHWVEDASEELTERFSDVYARLVAAQLADEPLRNVLLVEDPPVELERQRFLAHLYDERDYAPILVTEDGLTEPASAALDALRGVEAHGMDPQLYVSEALVAAAEVERQIAHAVAALPPITADRDEREAIAALVETAGEGSDDPALAALRAALTADTSPVPELAAAHDQNISMRRVARGNGAVLEALLVDALLSYAFDQRNFNTSWVDEDLDEDGRHELIAERTRETFEALANTTDAASFQAFFDALQPPHPQYELLLAERARYAAIVEAGGWERIEPRHVGRGSSGSTVTALQERLAAEGYFDGEVDGVFGDQLEEAVRAYQTTHQMDVTGESDRGFWNSINVPAEQRLAQIDLTLQRWRESRIGDDEYYVLVNVPDFHAELWRNGTREMRFRIVVGNTQQVCDPATNRLTYANATPLQTATMTYVVLNPMWNVPRRIVEEELLPELVENPLYFEEMGFEQYTTSGGIDIVRQLPGPENPLGRVKFMFPNPHNTYMHDTSRPQYFRYPVRAFSHGCMRVQEPLDLLEQILRNDGQWDEARVERIFESQQETSFTLNTPIPVHIEYYVVRVDDEGRANFLADIYRYDRDRMNPPSAESLRCQVEEAGPRLVLGEGDVVLYENDAGDRYTADQWNYVQAGGTLEQLEDGTFVDPPPGALEALVDGADADPTAEDGVDPSDPAAGDLGP